MSSAVVAFVSQRTSLANLPQSVTSLLFNSNTPAQNVVVELVAQRGLRTTHAVYLGWSGLTSTTNPAAIEVDPTFAQISGLVHGSKVNIKLHGMAPVAHTVHVEPVSPGDWEIVETNAGFLENWMINQVRAVSTKHPIAVFPSATAIACLKVVKIEPSLPAGIDFARLSPTSEVIVAPNLRKKPVKQQEHSIPAEVLASPLQQAAVYRASAYPYSDVPTRHLEIHGPFPEYPDGSIVSVSVLLPPSLDVGASKDDEVPPAKKIKAKLVKTDPVDSITISYGLSVALQTTGQLGAMLLVEPLNLSGKAKDNEGSGVVTIRPYAIQTQGSLSRTNDAAGGLKTGIAAELAKAIDLPFLGDRYIIPPMPLLPRGAIMQAAFEYGTATRFELGPEVAIAESRILPENPEEMRTKNSRPVVGREAIISKLLESLMTSAGVLVHGSRGCGKSAIIGSVVQSLEKYNIRPVRFSCGSFVDKGFPMVRDAFRRCLNEAAWHSPAVLILDDLDRLVPAEMEGMDSSRSQQLAEVIKSELKDFRSRRKIGFIAGALETSSLHSLIISSHMIDHIVHIKSPDKDLREAIITSAMRSLEIELRNIDMAEVSALTEGYQPGDLWTLIERVAAILALEPLHDKGTELLARAAAEYTPASLRGVKLEKSTTKWIDIGGLSDVKRILLETLEWPTKYAPIFAQCPLRLRSGLLLYGYPGCGKTFLASAVAGQTGLNFITVKGPEILNKYIGASEQSVRELFDRAQAAKPCVLFFDEFDSIAPKRGHDSTGVTDRVVNQLLTQMDGAEGLDGVYVLAATSRPDLIDSALLRPGRLDKSLLCDMPNRTDRYEILEKAASKMRLETDVELHVIAEQTDGFTGADLQALMYNAYLDAVHAVLDKEIPIKPAESNGIAETVDVCSFVRLDGTNIQIADVKAYLSAKGSPVKSNGSPAVDEGTNSLNVVVTMEHIEKALRNAKPSISPKEAQKFRRIYAQFVSDREGEMPAGQPSNEIGGRATLG